MIKKALIIIFGLGCAAVTAQAPEFMQQYNQRLGGWLESYTNLVAGLDTRAAEYKMTRDEYIEALRASTDPKVVAEANNIATWPVIKKKLEDAHTAFTEAPSWKRGIVFARHYQRPLLEATYGIYKPAAPTTAEGAAYGGVGFVIGAIVLNILLMILKLISRVLMAPVEAIKRRRGGGGKKINIGS